METRLMNDLPGVLIILNLSYGAENYTDKFKKQYR